MRRRLFVYGCILLVLGLCCAWAWTATADDRTYDYRQRWRQELAPCAPDCPETDQMPAAPTAPLPEDWKPQWQYHPDHGWIMYA